MSILTGRRALCLLLAASFILPASVLTPILVRNHAKQDELQVGARMRCSFVSPGADSRLRLHLSVGWLARLS
jgi:hypothetical protein